MQQVQMKLNDRYQIAWIDKFVKQGNFVTIKGQQELWEVVSVGQTQEPDKINRS